MVKTVPPSPFLGRKALTFAAPRTLFTLAKGGTAILGKPHKWGCLLLPLPAELAKEITNWLIEHIPDEDLGPGGRELRPHVTALYGFAPLDPGQLNELKAYLLRNGPITLSLGHEPSLFTQNEDGDVLILDVDSPALEGLHYDLEEVFGAPGNKHPEYKPHLTLAYLKPEASARYLRNAPPFAGREVVCDWAEYGAADGSKVTLPLAAAAGLWGAKAFCPTGEGGGIDPTCSPGEAGPDRRDVATRHGEGLGLDAGEQQAIEKFINGVHLKPKIEENDWEPDSDQAFRSAVAKLPPVSGLVHRGTSLPEGVASTLTPGKEVNFPQTRSWSQSVDFATDWAERHAEGDKVTVVFTLEHSGSAKDLSAINPLQQEALTSPGLRAIVDSVEDRGSHLAVRLTALRDGGASGPPPVRQNDASPSSGQEGYWAEQEQRSPEGVDRVQKELNALGWSLDETQERWLRDGVATVIETPIAELVPFKGEPLDEVDPQSRKIREIQEAWERDERHYIPQGFRREDGRIQIADGRHRIVAQRARGKTTVPMIITTNRFSTGSKALSWQHETSGGALVKPPAFGTKDKLPGGLAAGRPDSDFDPRQLAMGVEAELEHTSDRELAREIAKDHLTEDPEYYDKLKLIEGKSQKRGPAGEYCPHCDARLERGEDGVCNRCGKPWPLTKGAHRNPKAGLKPRPTGSNRLVRIRAEHPHVFYVQSVSDPFGIVNPASNKDTCPVKYSGAAYDEIQLHKRKGDHHKLWLEEISEAEYNERGYKALTLQSAGRWLAGKWEQLEQRYGRRVALGMAVAMLATLPVPGNVAAVVAAAEAVRGLHGYWQRSQGSGHQESYFATCDRDEGGRCKSVRPSPFEGRKSLMPPRIKSADEGDCKWVTIPADGKGGGGSPVCVGPDGEIRKGPAGLEGKTPSETEAPGAQKKPLKVTPENYAQLTAEYEELGEKLDAEEVSDPAEQRYYQKLEAALTAHEAKREREFEKQVDKWTKKHEELTEQRGEAESRLQDERFAEHTRRAEAAQADAEAKAERYDQLKEAYDAEAETARQAVEGIQRPQRDQAGDGVLDDLAGEYGALLEAAQDALAYESDPEDAATAAGKLERLASRAGAYVAESPEDAVAADQFASTARHAAAVIRAAGERLAQARQETRQAQWAYEAADTAYSGALTAGHDGPDYDPPGSPAWAEVQRLEEALAEHAKLEPDYERDLPELWADQQRIAEQQRAARQAQAGQKGLAGYPAKDASAGRTRTTNARGEECHWVTLGGGSPAPAKPAKGEGGKKKPAKKEGGGGGTPVCITGSGEVRKGPPALTGRDVDDLDRNRPNQTVKPSPVEKPPAAQPTPEQAQVPPAAAEPHDLENLTEQAEDISARVEQLYNERFGRQAPNTSRTIDVLREVGALSRDQADSMHRVLDELARRRRQEFDARFPAPTPAAGQPKSEAAAPAAQEGPAPELPPGKKPKGNRLSYHASVGNLSKAEGKKAVKDFFGKDIPDDTLAAIANAVDGVTVRLRKVGGTISLNWDGQGVDASRTLMKDEKGNLYVHNNLFTIDKDSPHKGKGLEFFLSQVQALREAGVAYIETHAAGHKGHPVFNGYYTWPRMGYDASIPYSSLNKLPAELKSQLKPDSTVLDLMDLPGGKEAWKEHGSDLIDAKFDLREGSRSMRTLAAYLQERAQRGQPERA